MIAALLDLEAIGSHSASGDVAGFARLLEFGRGLSRSVSIDGHLLAQIERSPSNGTHRPWAPGRAPSGRLALFNGEFHNRAAIAAELGAPELNAKLPGDAPVDDASLVATLYALALDRWGDSADEHVIGHYCAIVLAPDRASLRLSRSPLVAPPLHFRCDAEHGRQRALVASIPRPLFWQCDTTRRVNLDRLGRSRLVDYTDP